MLSRIGQAAATAAVKRHLLSRFNCRSSFPVVPCRHQLPGNIGGHHLCHRRTKGPQIARQPWRRLGARVEAPGLMEKEYGAWPLVRVAGAYWCQLSGCGLIVL